jgi:hypothetical protein
MVAGILSARIFSGAISDVVGFELPRWPQRNVPVDASSAAKHFLLLCYGHKATTRPIEGKPS